MSFRLIKQSQISQARLGSLKTRHGQIATPCFMPIATKAAVKSLTSKDLVALQAQIILSNTYHLFLQPGLKVLKKQAGLHRFMDWNRPILTDSGGFQVFSLAKIRKILPQGIEFQSHIDGSQRLLTPKKVLDIQAVIGSDIAMVLDICPSSQAERQEVLEAVTITSRWAEIAKKHHQTPGQLLFGIVQGGLFPDLRQRSLADLVKLNFDGYAIGGLAVGESHAEMYGVLKALVPEMPKSKPRYLMGVGTPDNIFQAVKQGVDMFDCVIPTREARHGRLYVKTHAQLISRGKLNYTTININNAKYALDTSSLNSAILADYSKAYLHHLFKTHEPLALRLATLNNLHFYLNLMTELRSAIKHHIL